MMMFIEHSSSTNKITLITWRKVILYLRFALIVQPQIADRTHGTDTPHTSGSDPSG